MAIPIAHRRSSAEARHIRAAVLHRRTAVGLFVLLTGAAEAQTVTQPGTTALSRDTLAAPLDSLVALAIATSPAIRAAELGVDAARARLGPATARPDPMVMFGIQNFPLSRPGFSSDEMTMKMVGVSQTIPYRGKLTLRRLAADREVDVARAGVEVARRQVARDVKDAYYELAFLDQAVGIVEHNAEVLSTFIRATEARYGAGAAGAGQQDILKARVEAARLAETASTVHEQHRTALAQLNALLSRPSEAPIRPISVPDAIARAAAGDSLREPTFTSAALGARAADSPLRALAELQQVAIEQSPELREHEAMIAAQAARLEIARKEYLPDVDVALQYGQRSRLPDMVSLSVSVPIPAQRKQKQDQMVAEASATLASLHAGHQAKVNELRAAVAKLVSEIERSRTQLALTRRAILPQARAALASSLASYQTGGVEFLTVLDNQTTVFSYETEYYRAIADFAKNVAELERIVGAEVIR